MALRTLERHRLEPTSHEAVEFKKFMCPPAEPGRTLDAVTPDVRIKRDLLVGMDLALPFRRSGSNKLKMWVIQDPAQGPVFPSAPVRVRQGQVVHCATNAKGNDHTIHWHGIEPTPMNDGVGKHSFEIKGNYTYQWLAGNPGLYFYHCHKNTPLHFEMGLFGGLIIDPPEGPGHVQAAGAPGDVLAVDREVIWVCTAHDSRWHRLGTDAFLINCGASPNERSTFTTDGVLNDWRPDVFTISGTVQRDDGTPIAPTGDAAKARRDETILIRLLNASYALQEYRIGADVTIIAEDGRSYGVGPYNKYCRPRTVRAGTPIRVTSAMRYDLIVKPTVAGSIPFTVDYIDWQGRRTYGQARTSIKVS